MIILASQSPRRKELLKLITKNFSVEPSDVEETIEGKISIEEYPKFLAEKKTLNIFNNNHQSDVVIGCDTGVFIDGKMLGKPKDKDDAFNMLKQLSGNIHKVITGCCVVSSKGKITFDEITQVEFFALSDEEILNYIDTKEPMDKAGSYGIQGKGALFVKKIVGDYYSVVGFPVARINKEIQKLLNAN